MSSRKLRFSFIVQAEGRGHMTQAISLYDMLTRNSHEVTCVFIGKSKRRDIPQFFREAIKCPIYQLDSPNFVTDKDNKSIRLFASILHNLKFVRRFVKSLKFIHSKNKEFEPDVMLNFYDFLGGFYFRFFRTNVRHVCIGHQFLSDHPDFPFASNHQIDKFLFRRNNGLTSQKAWKKLALSFRPYDPIKFQNTVVTPPLLREEIKSLKPEAHDYILGYMVNDGYGDDIIEWHKKNPSVIIHAFWDRKGVPEQYSPNPNLTFHQLSAKKFMSKMENCKGFISTAGFESICEAMYLGKPVMMIPVEGQYEQSCNAIDAEIAGAGISSSNWEMQRFIDYIPEYSPVSQYFQKWANSAEEIFLKELTEL